jgi:hypothetical protein
LRSGSYLFIKHLTYSRYIRFSLYNDTHKYLKNILFYFYPLTNKSYTKKFIIVPILFFFQTRTTKLANQKRDKTIKVICSE